MVLKKLLIISLVLLIAFPVCSEEEKKSELETALEDAYENRPELEKALNHFTNEKRATAEYLIKQMPHLDRLEMTAETLIEHIEYAYKTREESKIQLDDEFFQKFIATYRISYEVIKPWRKLLYNDFHYLMKEDIDTQVREICKWVNEHIKKTERSSIFGPQQSPTQTYNGRKGTDNDKTILTIAILKSLGIPCRKVYTRAFTISEKYQVGEHGKSWLEFYNAEKWLPVYLDAPDDIGNFQHFAKYDSVKVASVWGYDGFELTDLTENYTKTGTVKIQFFNNGKLYPDYKDFTINIFSDGFFDSLDELGESTDSTGYYQANLGNGLYYLIYGYRDGEGNPSIKIKDFFVNIDDTTHLEIDLLMPEIITEIDNVLYKKLAELKLNGNKSIITQDSIQIIIFIDNEEPSRRIVPKFVEKKDIIPFIKWVLTEDTSDEIKKLLQNNWLYCDKDKLSKDLGFNAIMDYPAVIVIKNHQLVMKSLGYNTNVIKEIDNLSF
ncbi:MAG: hypothetical protein DRH57_04125 [Candidatus Cloacimonadota bacterium]|nr:MAG: hypothetical protein DRH57_04125 [Candidatus Cloacimonadota bacterium]